MPASRSVHGAAPRPRHGRTRALGAAYAERRDRESVCETPVVGEKVGGRAGCRFADRASLGAVIVLAGAFF
jgi:hypothetical protein